MKIGQIEKQRLGVTKIYENATDCLYSVRETLHHFKLHSNLRTECTQKAVYGNKFLMVPYQKHTKTHENISVRYPRLGTSSCTHWEKSN